MSNKTAYIFSGQGFAFSEIDRLKDPRFPDDICVAYEAIFGEELKQISSLSSEDCKKNEISAALLMTSTFQGLRYKLPPADFMAGFSVGQYIALYAAGALCRQDLVNLVFKRCEYMNSAARMLPGAMVSVLGLGLDVVRGLAESNNVWVSNDNAPGNVTVSGGVDSVKAFCEAAKSQGAYKLQLIPTSGAWHCPLMASAENSLAAAISNCDWRPTTSPVIGNVSVSELQVDNYEDQLLAHLTQAVRWRETIQYLVSLGVTQFIEISHFDLLVKMGPFINRKAKWKSAHRFVEY